MQDTGRLLKQLVARALREDLGPGDITTLATIDRKARGRARIISKDAGVVAGTQAAGMVFKILDKQARVVVHAPDGRKIKKNDVIMEITGSMRALLSGERTALNFLQQLSGVATLTRAYADAVQGLETRILDTRKTTPGLRLLEKQAVRSGGGYNHRIGLYDMFLVKNNHVDATGGVGTALQKVQTWKKLHHNRCAVEIEARTIDEVKQALALKPDRIMLDNMPVSIMRRAVKLIRATNRRVEIEASGNASLDMVRVMARTGVDFISVGALTHSAPALDLSLRITAE
jgi:nicotinate-nucleotide pyrophosphorylase (carboxylating)